MKTEGLQLNNRMDGWIPFGPTSSDHMTSSLLDGQAASPTNPWLLIGPNHPARKRRRSWNSRVPLSCQRNVEVSAEVVLVTWRAVRRGVCYCKRANVRVWNIYFWLEEWQRRARALQRGEKYTCVSTSEGRGTNGLKKATNLAPDVDFSLGFGLNY